MNDMEIGNGIDGINVLIARNVGIINDQSYAAPFNEFW
jgi:hypothetical protein